MASLGLTTTLSTCRQVVVKSPWNSRAFVPVRRFQATPRNEAATAFESGKQAAKQSANEAKKVGQDAKNRASSAAEDMSKKSKDIAGEASKAAQDITEKAKQTMQDAWGSVKDTTQKIKDTVAGKTEESAEFVKENADKVKRDMNTKN